MIIGRTPGRRTGSELGRPARNSVSSRSPFGWVRAALGNGRASVRVSSLLHVAAAAPPFQKFLEQLFFFCIW
jgi:hypothetical protein